MKTKFYGNPKTKVLHRRGTRGDACRVRELKSYENFDSVSEAKKKGYRLCKICGK